MSDFLRCAPWPECPFSGCCCQHLFTFPFFSLSLQNIQNASFLYKGESQCNPIIFGDTNISITFIQNCWILLDKYCLLLWSSELRHKNTWSLERDCRCRPSACMACHRCLCHARSKRWNPCPFWELGIFVSPGWKAWTPESSSCILLFKVLNEMKGKCVPFHSLKRENLVSYTSLIIELAIYAAD